MSDFRALRRALNLTQAEAADLCGSSKRSIAGWESGETPQPTAALRLLWACKRDPTLLDALLRGAESPDRLKTDAQSANAAIHSRQLP